MVTYFCSRFSLFICLSYHVCFDELVMVIIVVFATSLLSLSIYNIMMLFHLVHVYNISIAYLISSLFLPFGIFVLWAMCNNVFLNRLFSVFFYLVWYTIWDVAFSNSIEKGIYNGMGLWRCHMLSQLLRKCFVIVSCLLENK